MWPPLNVSGWLSSDRDATPGWRTASATWSRLLSVGDYRWKYTCRMRHYWFICLGSNGRVIFHFRECLFWLSVHCTVSIITPWLQLVHWLLSIELRTTGGGRWVEIPVRHKFISFIIYVPTQSSCFLFSVTGWMDAWFSSFTVPSANSLFGLFSFTVAVGSYMAQDFSVWLCLCYERRLEIIAKPYWYGFFKAWSRRDGSKKKNLPDFLTWNIFYGSHLFVDTIWKRSIRLASFLAVPSNY